MKRIVLNILGVIAVEAALYLCYAATGAPMNPIAWLILAWMGIGMSVMMYDDCSKHK